MNEIRFAAAITPLLRAGSGRCWINALIGTAKNPAKNPISPSSAATSTNPMMPLCPSAAPKIVMPAAPNGIRPYSILPPDKYPAARLPIPIPMATDACR